MSDSTAGGISAANGGFSLQISWEKGDYLLDEL